MSLTVLVGRTSSNWLPAAVWPSAAKYERAHGGSARPWPSRCFCGLQKCVYRAKATARRVGHGCAYLAGAAASRPHTRSGE